MTRLQADLALGLAGLIWGFGFVAQKDALGHIGPCTFVAIRFLLSAAIVFPLVWWEYRRGESNLSIRPILRLPIAALCAAFAVAVLLQQIGLGTTTVTNTSFLTGLYVVMVAPVGWLLYRQKLSSVVSIAGVLSVLGIWLLAGGHFDALPQNFGFGDLLVLGCAFGFAFQVAIMGHIAKQIQSPFLLSFLQYLAVGIVALALALIFEHIDFHAIRAAWASILYAAVASGGIAYTLQSIAQQYTPSADTAIIMSSESLFGAVGGIWLMGDRLTFYGGVGCAAIIAAIILVELVPQFSKQRRARKKAVR